MKGAVLKIFIIIIGLIFISCGDNMKNFKPVHIKSTHTIKLNGRVEDTFKLFTAEGEKLWVKGWEPEFYYPETNRTKEGAVFVTSMHGDKKTIWTCVELDETKSSVKYVRTIPGNNTAIVSVKCLRGESDKTIVEVTYEITSLSEEGNTYTEDFIEEQYKNYINSWETEINKYLQTL